MSDVVRRPTFAHEEIERQRQQALSGLKVSAEDPDIVAGQVIDRLIYGFHPYGLPGNGTAESLASLTRQDFVDFHRQFFVPNNALIAVVGDVSADEAMAGLREGFRRLAAGRGAGVQPTDPPDADQARHRHRQAGRGADRDPRRPDRHSAQAQRLPGDGSGGEDSRRRGRQPPAAGAAVAARSHLRRVGRSRHVQDGRWRHRRNRHADANTAEALRVVVDEFTSCSASASTTASSKARRPTWSGISR